VTVSAYDIRCLKTRPSLLPISCVQNCQDRVLESFALFPAGRQRDAASHDANPTAILVGLVLT